jgi:pimeloyl-ACP methyl ester carboxylesterase
VRPRLLLVPAFTELQWTIKPMLEEWAEVASYDPPGVGAEPAPPELAPRPPMSEDERRAALRAWRGAAAHRGLELVDELGWDRFFLVVDGEGTRTGLNVAKARPEAVEGIAIGHAALSRSTEGERPAINKEVWAGMGALLKTDREAFIRSGIAQVTARSISDSVAGQMVKRFPDSELASRLWELLGAEAEPIEEDLVALDLRLLLGEHAGCLGSTEEGYQDIVARFPDAARVSCPEACCASPAFAEALRDFCGGRAEVVSEA